LEDGADRIVGKALVGTEIPERDMGILRPSGEDGHEENDRKERSFHYSFFDDAR
jgi:hypothetical protein